jgi:hypothetical protein
MRLRGALKEAEKSHPDELVVLCFQDEMRVGQKGRLCPLRCGCYVVVHPWPGCEAVVATPTDPDRSTRMSVHKMPA